MTISEIRAIVDTMEPDEAYAWLCEQNDTRKAVEQLKLKMARKVADINKEEARLDEMTAIEEAIYESGATAVAGIDEVGRGPLFGPVVTACVLLPRGIRINGMNDSKKLSEAQREHLYDEVMRVALAVGIGMADAQTIDRINILEATRLAMRNAFSEMGVRPDYLLVDAEPLSGVDVPVLPVIKGDARCHCIAAASVIAKVTRDRMMKEIGKQYPEYGFEQHKGYGTSDHIQAIRKYGPLEDHRRSFIKNI